VLLRNILNLHGKFWNKIRIIEIESSMVNTASIKLSGSNSDCRMPKKVDSLPVPQGYYANFAVFQTTTGLTKAN
jgi:hypothetical protein